jgi:glycerol-3-phosphate acyltransferase PlsY
VVWLAVAFATRFSSLAALVAAVVTPIALYVLGHQDAALLFAVLSVIVFVKHRANIGRLVAGTETRIGAKG